MPQILLYDASTGELAAVDRGDAIRVEIHTADLAAQGLVDVASTRPFVLFSLLQRLLHSEGLPTKFVFGSRDAGQLMRELDLHAELRDEEAEEAEERGEADAAECQGASDESAEVTPGPAERALFEQQCREQAGSSVEDYSGRCVDIRFGAAREGEREWTGEESAARMTLSDAMRRFGHHALVFYLMGTHYSQPLGDPVAGMLSARRHLQRLRETLAGLRRAHPSPDDMRHHVAAFRQALATDLDTPGALVALFEWVLEAERRKCQLGDADLRAMLELLELSDLEDAQSGATALGTS